MSPVLQSFGDRVAVGLGEFLGLVLQVLEVVEHA
jgi:hypothetical protein